MGEFMENEDINEIKEDSTPKLKRAPMVSIDDSALVANGVGQASNVSAPPNLLTSMYLTRFGIILSNLAIVMLVVSLGSVLTVVGSVLVIVLGFAFMIASCGLVFTVMPDYWQRLMSATGLIGKVSEVMFQYWPIVTVVGILCSVASIVFLSFDKTKKHTARIALAGVVIAFIVAFSIVMISGGAK